MPILFAYPIHLTLREIVQDTVFKSKAGVDGIAEEFGCHTHSLYSMLNPHDHPKRGHKLGFMDWIRILRITLDLRSLDRVNQEFGRVSFEMPDMDRAMTDKDWLKHAARLAKEHGEALTELSGAMEDGRIDEGERKQLRKEVFDCIRAGVALYKALENKI